MPGVFETAGSETAGFETAGSEREGIERAGFETEVDASTYLLRVAGTAIGEAYKALALDRLCLRPGDTVVDLGCGPGTDLARYAEAVGPTGRVVGVDLDPTALRDARARTASLPAVEVREADVASVGLPSGSVDAVHADRVLQHVIAPAAVVDEAARLLRRGGRVVLAEPDWRTLVVDHPEPRLADAFTRYVVDHQVRNARVGIALPRLCRTAGLTVSGVTPATAVLDDLTAADRLLGFERVTRRAVDRGVLSAEDGRRWLDGLTAAWGCAAVTLVVVAATKED